MACVAKPDTILVWYRRHIAKKFDGSKHRQYPDRPKVQPEVEALVVQMARENTGWTASSERWPIWATACPIRRCEHSATPRHCSGSEAKPEDVLEGFYRRSPVYRRSPECPGRR